MYQKDETLLLRLMKQEAEKLGIKFLVHYGYRYFLNNGEVFGTTTNNEWNAFIGQESLVPTVVKSHYLRYLKLLNKENQRYQIRRKEDADTEFLHHLVEAGMCNSLTIYAKHNDSIKVYFFVADPTDKGANRYFYNNLFQFEKIVNSVENHLNKLRHTSLITISNKEKLFSDYDRKLIFGDTRLVGTTHNKVIYLNSQCFELKPREIQILNSIRGSYTLKKLSEETGLSLSGVNFCLTGLKKKLDGKHKEDIVQFAKQVQELI